MYSNIAENGMQQKFFSKEKKEKDMEMLNFEKKCGKLPIDKCKKILFNKRKKFCEIQKIVKNFNHVLRNNAYHDNDINVIKNFFQLPPASFLPLFNTKWRLFFRKFSKNLKSFNFVLISCAYYDNYKRHNVEIDLAPYLYKPFILRYGRCFFSKKIKSVNLILGDNLYYIEYPSIVKFCADFFVSSRNRRHNFVKTSKNLKRFNLALRINGYHDTWLSFLKLINNSYNLCGAIELNKKNDGTHHIASLKNAVFSAKPVQIPIKWPEKKFWNINDLLTITRYHWNCHINRFLKILHGVQSPVPRRKRTPVSMFKKSIYIINVFINQATDALRGLSINKIGDYLYTTTLKKELLVVFFNLLKKYFISPRFIKFV